jgi:hypothetical protein
MSVEAKPLMKACALTWVSTGLTVAVMLGLSLGLIGGIIRTLPHCCHSTHYFFLSIFVPLIGIVAAVNADIAMDTLGYKELRKSVGLRTGIAAALGFLSVGLILLYGLGWEVGHPIPGKYAMLKLALFCSIGAALAGGLAMGWMLEKIKIR